MPVLSHAFRQAVQNQRTRTAGCDEQTFSVAKSRCFTAALEKAARIPHHDKYHDGMAIRFATRIRVMFVCHRHVPRPSCGTRRSAPSREADQPVVWGEGGPGEGGGPKFRVFSSHHHNFSFVSPFVIREGPKRKPDTAKQRPLGFHTVVQRAQVCALGGARSSKHHHNSMRKT